MPNEDTFKKVDNSVALDTIEDENLKICVAIKRWVEDNIKDVRKVPDQGFRLSSHKLSIICLSATELQE